MVIYEVNLTIQQAIFSEYYAWLMNHIEQMLQFRGFKAAELAKEKSLDADTAKMTIRYTVESENDLNHYLEQHAAAMREEGIKRFGNQFSAVRRIFVEAVKWGK